MQTTASAGTQRPRQRYHSCNLRRGVFKTMHGWTFEDVRRGLVRPRFLLISDLDHTMVQNEDLSHAHLLEFGQVWSAQFAHDSLLVYSTGRSPALFQELWKEAPLLTPDVIICSVGTEVFCRASDGSYLPDIRWRQLLDSGSGWDRAQLLQLLRRFEHLRPQQASEQRPHKLSFHLEPGVAQDPAMYLQQVQAALAAEGLAANLVYSGGRDVDLLAPGADKGRALAFLLNQIPDGCRPELGCQVNGDSGNDIALFQVPGVRGCVVANAHLELRTWYQQHAQEGRVLLASKPCAGGILEALQHFGTLAAAAAQRHLPASPSLQQPSATSAPSGSQVQPSCGVKMCTQVLVILQQLLGAVTAPAAGGATGDQAKDWLLGGCTVLGGVVPCVASSPDHVHQQLQELRRTVALLDSHDCASGATSTSGRSAAARQGAAAADDCGDAAGSQQGVCWLDQLALQHLDGGACVAAALVCRMDPDGRRRANRSVAVSVLLQQRGGNSGAAAGCLKADTNVSVGSVWKVGHIHWHEVPAVQPVFVL